MTVVESPIGAWRTLIVGCAADALLLERLDRWLAPDPAAGLTFLLDLADRFEAGAAAGRAAPAAFDELEGE